MNDQIGLRHRAVAAPGRYCGPGWSGPGPITSPPPGAALTRLRSSAQPAMVCNLQTTSRTKPARTSVEIDDAGLRRRIFHTLEQNGKSADPTAADTFRTEQKAKAFARAKLAESLNINAGTINPHLPKRTISSAQLLDWLDEPDS
jgi:hypothetical protein